jgi:hypothetical protein
MKVIVAFRKIYFKRHMLHPYSLVWSVSETVPHSEIASSEGVAETSASWSNVVVLLLQGSMVHLKILKEKK